MGFFPPRQGQMGESEKWDSSDGAHLLPFHPGSPPPRPLTWPGPHAGVAFGLRRGPDRRDLEGATRGGDSEGRKGGAVRGGGMVEPGATPSPETDGERHRETPRLEEEGEQGGGAARAGPGRDSDAGGEARRAACSLSSAVEKEGRRDRQGAKSVGRGRGSGSKGSRRRREVRWGWGTRRATD